MTTRDSSADRCRDQWLRSTRLPREEGELGGTETPRPPPNNRIQEGGWCRRWDLNATPDSKPSDAGHSSAESEGRSDAPMVDGADRADTVEGQTRDKPGKAG